MNKFESFTPLMHEKEYRFIEKYLTKDDIFLEWGSGNGTIYFSGLVKKLITIEHDVDYWNLTQTTIDLYDIKNIENILITSKVNLPPTKENRYKVFEEYIHYPKNNNLEFTKVLVDGRARKYCVLGLLDTNYDGIVFLHDSNFNDVEGYVDDEYFKDIYEHYDVIDRVEEGRGIVALKRKNRI